MSHVEKPKVVIFSDHLLYPSETFIRTQGEALCEFEAIYAGSRRVQGLNLPEDRTLTINRGTHASKLEEVTFKLLGFAPTFDRRLRSLNPTLIHAHHGANGFRALPLARNLDVPLIITFHGSDATATDLRYQKPHFGHRQYLKNKGSLQKRGALFLAVSDFIRKKLLQQGFPEDRVVLHYTGVNTDLFSPASTETAPTILFVGRLVERKGAEFVIKATAEVQQQMPRVNLVLIGDGPSRADLEKQARQSLASYQFLGVQNHEEVRKWMNRASTFCAPSVKVASGEEEAFGMVYAEAQAVGKPVVAFDSGGISEVVEHGVTGFLAAERDWQALAQHLIFLLKNAELRKQFGAAGRSRILRLFDLEKRTRLLEEIYTNVSTRQSLLGEKPCFDVARAS
jgi:colanic acid/amylovoran biosynthesis glycosyltransferase